MLSKEKAKTRVWAEIYKEADWSGKDEEDKAREQEWKKCAQQRLLEVAETDEDSQVQ